MWLRPEHQPTDQRVRGSILLKGIHLAGACAGGNQSVCPPLPPTLPQKIKWENTLRQGLIKNSLADSYLSFGLKNFLL